MARFELPDGWAELRSAATVTERQRRPIAKSIRSVRPEVMELANQASTLREQMEKLPEGAPERKSLQEEQDKLTINMAGTMTEEEADAFNAAQDHAVVALVASWSFDLPITIDGVLDLPGRSYDALRAKVAMHVGELFLSTQPDPNPKAPGGGSNGSATPSMEALQTTSPPSGAPIDSYSSGSL